MINELFTIQIVEDEGVVAADLAERLKYNGYTIAGITDNFNDAITMFKLKIPDLVLIDITIKGPKSGIDVAVEMNKILPTPFIFITAHTDAATLQKAKSTFPASYLVKPFTSSHLFVSVELALHNFAYQKNLVALTPIALNNTEDDIYLKQDYVFIKEGQQFIKLHKESIMYMEAQDNYVKIFTTQKSYLIRCTFSKTLQKVQHNAFVRIHRSYCVNINKIDSFTEHDVNINNIKIPIGRNYKEDFVKTLALK